MKNLIPWFHIVIAVFVYIVVALLASYITRKKGKNLKEVEGRTSPFILFIGAAANLLVLVLHRKMMLNPISHLISSNSSALSS